MSSLIPHFLSLSHSSGAAHAKNSLRGDWGNIMHDNLAFIMFVSVQSVSGYFGLSGLISAWMGHKSKT